MGVSKKYQKQPIFVIFSIFYLKGASQNKEQGVSQNPKINKHPPVYSAIRVILIIIFM